MSFISTPRYALTGILLFILCIGLLGSSGDIYAAERTVVGELFSADG